MFEIKERGDGASRIGILYVRNKKVETPFIFPVINPNKLIIHPKDIEKKFKINTVITNAYILYKNKFEINEIHKFLDFNGIIETDSGSYQMLHYKKEIEIDNKTIIEFQIKINSDIINVLDIPTDVDASYEKAKEDLEITLKRIKEGLEIKEKKNYDGLINGAIQGGIYLDLRKKSALEVSKLNVDIFAIGTIVPYMIKYEFKKLFEIILESRINLPLNKPVHLFGLGHPLILPLSVLLGCDIFDSASYALYAYDHRILTPFGTVRLEELKYFEFETPFGFYSLNEVLSLEENEKIKILAAHNLWILKKEIEIIKDAIYNGYLYEWAFLKAHSHYKVYEATKFVLEKYYQWLKKLDPVRKRWGITYKGELLELRADIKRALERLKERVNPKDYDLIYEYLYPFKDLKNIR